jgi:hypothetical protein
MGNSFKLWVVAGFFTTWLAICYLAKRQNGLWEKTVEVFKRMNE